MRVLVLTFYFEPDLSAGSFRNTALVRALKEMMGPHDVIDVITTRPNRYSTFTVSAPQSESWEQVNIYRIALPRHESGMLDQSRAFLWYAIRAWQLSRGKKYDVVFASSSRLFTAFLGACIARRARARFYADIRDIFTETIQDVLGKWSLFRILLPVFRRIERYTIQTADIVNLVSEGFRDHFETIDPVKEYRFFTNGIDEEFLNYEYTTWEPAQTVRILYAGNIGAGQALDSIIPGVAEALGPKYEFVVIGDGSTRDRLEAELNKRGITNVSLHRPVARQQLISWYAKADILFLHLNNRDAFRKVIPSKIFEYAATGKPILAGVAGYAATFLRTQVPNSAVFAPGDVRDCLRALSTLELRHTDRQEFIERYRRRNITRRMASDVLQLASQK